MWLSRLVIIILLVLAIASSRVDYGLGSPWAEYLDKVDNLFSVIDNLNVHAREIHLNYSQKKIPTEEAVSRITVLAGGF